MATVINFTWLYSIRLQSTTSCVNGSSRGLLGGSISSVSFPTPLHSSNEFTLIIFKTYKV
jgi:hypothetical protein